MQVVYGVMNMVARWGDGCAESGSTGGYDWLEMRRSVGLVAGKIPLWTEVALFHADIYALRNFCGRRGEA